MMLREMTKEELEKCKGCKFYERTSVFELCKREESQYNVAGRIDFHTIGHMRLYECRDARLWRPSL